MDSDVEREGRKPVWPFVEIKSATECSQNSLYQNTTHKVKNI